MSENQKYKCWYFNALDLDRWESLRPVLTISGLSSEDLDFWKKINTPGFYLDFPEKSIIFCFRFSFISIHTFRLQIYILYHHLEKRCPVYLVYIVWLYDLCRLHNRCSKPKARNQLRGGNQGFVVEKINETLCINFVQPEKSAASVVHSCGAPPGGASVVWGAVQTRRGAEG